MKIGERIAFFRTGKGYSVNNLANQAWVSQRYLREVELGSKNPTVEFLSVLCDTMGFSLKEFFDEQPDDPLVSKIYQLAPVQREALARFLDTMIQ